MIVQGTGSRDLKAEHLPVAFEVLQSVTAGHAGPHKLRQGGARGADTLLAVAARRLGWEVETYRADWDAPCRDTCKPDHRRPGKNGGPSTCPAAGNYRNQLMVDQRPIADVCAAIYLRGAKNIGTSDCVKRAGAAHIPIERRTA